MQSLAKASSIWAMVFLLFNGLRSISRIVAGTPTTTKMSTTTQRPMSCCFLPLLQVHAFSSEQRSISSSRSRSSKHLLSQSRFLRRHNHQTSVPTRRSPLLLMEPHNHSRIQHKLFLSTTTASSTSSSSNTDDDTNSNDVEEEELAKPFVPRKFVTKPFQVRENP
jgi:hypothetical protein